MALTSAQRVRQRIQDYPRPFDGVFAGDGISTRFSLPNTNLTSASAFVGVGNPPSAWSGTGATFNTSGFVEFANVLSASAPFRVSYVYSVFDDATVDEYLSAEGSIAGAALQFAYDLQFDALKRTHWRAADGSENDDTKAMDMLGKIIAAIQNEQLQDAVLGGGFQSWAITQDEV